MVLSDEMLQHLVGFFAALMGAGVGGMCTIYATRLTLRESEARELRKEEREVQSLLDAIGVEVGALWTFHMRRIGGGLEQLKDGEALEFYYPLTQDYFTIYNTNADKIGKVKHQELREAIVVCYNKCKKVVDGFKYNNELYRDWREMAHQMASMPLADPAREAMEKGLLNTKHQALKDYAKVLKEDHFELKGYVENLLTQLVRER